MSRLVISSLAIPLRLRDSSPTESGRTALVLRFAVEVAGLIAEQSPLVQRWGFDLSWRLLVWSRVGDRSYRG